MIKLQKKTESDLHIFLGVIATLVTTGLLFIYSASSIYAVEHFSSAHYFVRKQAFGLLIGCITLCIGRFFPLTILKKLSPLFFFSTLVLTGLTLTPFLSRHIHGSSRWIQLFGFSFQPSELLKVALILYVAHLLAKKEFRTSSFWHSFFPLMAILGVTSLILLKQPDFGLTVTLCTTTFILLFIAHFQIKHLLLTLSALVPAAIVLIVKYPYRLQRVLTFLNPWADPQGAGFQIIQSLIAIGSGGFWGLGISQSKQKFFYLPMQHTDFIFSIIAEETGFIGSCVVITLFVLFLYLGISIANQLKNSFTVFTTLGFVFLINLQAIINLAVATGLAPTKGIGLPFVSFGNTALVCNLFMVGIIMNMVHNNTSS